MMGERDLNILLCSLAPTLLPGTFVFVTVPSGRYGAYAELEPLVSVQEREGLSLMLASEHAAALPYPSSSALRCISLGVHSSLDAVGLTAVVSSALAEAGISANVVAGFYHDHIFVPAASAERALARLGQLTSP